MLRNIPEEGRSHQHCGGSLKSLKLFFINTVILIATKIVIMCLNQTGNKQYNKNKQEITTIIVSLLCYTIYNANKYQYNLYNSDLLIYNHICFIIMFFEI
jgi:glucose uptake protein GlcU